MNIKGLIQSLLFLSGALCVGFAQAGIILPGGEALLEDDNLEYVLDSNNNVKTTGALAVGDTLVAYITFDKTQDGGSNTVQELGAPGQELTGISQIQIASITPAGPVTVVTFAPDPDFEGIYGAGAVAALFEQGTGDFFSAGTCTSIAACDSVVLNGNQWMTAGFQDDDDYWTFIAGGALQPIETVAGLGSGVSIGFANYALTILTNNTGYTFNQQFCVNCSGTDQLVDIVGSGQVLGGSGLSSPFFARSDFDFQLNRVPEPASLALMSLGLLGLGVFGRRRKFAA